MVEALFYLPPHTLKQPPSLGHTGWQIVKTEKQMKQNMGTG